MRRLIEYLKRGYRYIRLGQPIVNVEVKTTSPSNVLSGRTVLITGGSKGLGFAIAHRCIDEGAKVALLSRSADELTRACDKLGSMSVALCADISDLNSLRDIFDRAESALGSPIDSLVSNAGVSLHEGDFRNVTEDGWDTQMNTNLKGGYFLCKEFVRYLEMRNANYGNILVVSSERARRPDDIPYGLTKSATDSYIKALGSKLINEGIRVNGIAPGVTATDMTGKAKDGNFAGSQNNGRVFHPDEVAEVACFLLSDSSACISGEIIACNQGNHIVCWKQKSCITN